MTVLHKRERGSRIISQTNQKWSQWRAPGRRARLLSSPHNYEQTHQTLIHAVSQQPLMIIHQYFIINGHIYVCSVFYRRIRISHYTYESTETSHIFIKKRVKIILIIKRSYDKTCSLCCLNDNT